jgi:hypothetical protein
MNKPILGMLILMLTSCVSPGEPTNQTDSVLMLGEAAYFTTRCPTLKQDQQRSALIVACLFNNTEVSKCTTADGRPLAVDVTLGSSKARKEFSSMPSEQVCHIADERYGKNGSRFKNLLVQK